MIKSGTLCSVQDKDSRYSIKHIMSTSDWQSKHHTCESTIIKKIKTWKAIYFFPSVFFAHKSI